MSGIEYIVDFGDKSSAFVGLAMAEVKVHGATLHEPIVRCRDCRYYSEYQDLCERLHPGMLVMEPDGYCAWGERMVDE